MFHGVRLRQHRQQLQRRLQQGVTRVAGGGGADGTKLVFDDAKNTQVLERFAALLRRGEESEELVQVLLEVQIGGVLLV